MKIGRSVSSAIASHSALDTGVHGVGVSTVCSETEADGKITTHDGLAAPHSAAGFARLTVAETEVFSGNTPATSAWTELDLSGTLGANAALVLLKIGVAGGAVAFRKKGDTDEFWNVARADSGCGVALSAVAGAIYFAMLVATDDTGKIEWKAEAESVAVTIDIIAYIK